MYVKRIQIVNYGPIDRLDITFPFEGNTPKPVVLVGENGSGKSILLSHIVNGLISAKDSVHPDTPEVESNKVYKIRSSNYIKSRKEFYFARADFQDDLFTEEIWSERPKETYSNPPAELSGKEAKAAWGKMNPEAHEHYHSNIFDRKDKIKDTFSKNCILYFPPNRFEEPAWLNEENLIAKAEYLDLKHIKGYTSRKVINYSPLRVNQNWLFEVIYDRAVFEIQTLHLNMPVQNSQRIVPIPVFRGYSGQATHTYDMALQIVRSIIKEDQNIRFGIGGRHSRVVSVEGKAGQLVPNIFQLSSGVTSLLNLFLSILRDFDLSNSSLAKAEDIRGIVIVDEIDLHLHVAHQYTILPQLIKMFPNVQFVVTTHSPLFVLGMKNVFGKDGFALYRLPQGQQISPEEFSEFANAYQTFTTTSRFLDDVRKAVKSAQKPFVFVEGPTDKKCLEKAFVLLGQEAMSECIDIRAGGGVPNLKKVWNNFPQLADFPPQKTMLLFDCDYEGDHKNKGNFFRRKIPRQSDHPVQKGIENLFSKATLEKARSYEPAFIDITPEHTITKRGKSVPIPEKWTINPDEKTNLCNWLCENGTAEDFQHFQVIVDLLRGILDEALTESADQSSQGDRNLARRSD